MIPLEDLVGEAPAFDALEVLVQKLLLPLEPHVPNLKVGTYIPAAVKMPFVLVRREPHAYASENFGGSDFRFGRRAVIQIQVFTSDLADGEGDGRANQLCELASARLFTAWRKQEVVPGSGHLGDFVVLSPPHRVSDWATSTGVVQYANLPKNCHRYEVTLGVNHRPDLSAPTPRLSLFT